MGELCLVRGIRSLEGVFQPSKSHILFFQIGVFWRGETI